VLAAAAGAYLLSRRTDFLDDAGDDSSGPREPVGLGDLSADQLIAALPDGTDPDDASDAIADQLARLRSTGRGGRLHLPPGDWTISRPIELDTPHLHLTGAGMRATRLHMAPGVDGHMIQVDGNGVVVERLSLRGVGLDDPDLAGHGIRVGSSATDVLLRDLLVEDVPSYGIGLQPRDARVGDARLGGVFDGLSMRNVVIRRCGQDGIDIKNIDETIDACSLREVETLEADCNGRRTFLRNLAVSEVGLLAAADDGKPAIDVRGVRSLQNVEMFGLDRAAFGIRFRNDPGGPPNGLGGGGSTIENFVVLQAGTANPGVERSGTDGVEVHNGFVVAAGQVEQFT
jgi:hypothetical protein